MEAMAARMAKPVQLKILTGPEAKNGAHPKTAEAAPHNDQKDGEHLWKETAKGFRYCHKRLNANTSKIFENSSFLYALVELLVEKGLISLEELDERKKRIAARLVEQFKDSGLGLRYQDPESDKYTFTHTADVDCENRLHACQARCCKFPFALSQQDVEENIIHWDFGQPYMIAHGEDGYCVHLDREAYACTEREHRPVPCRGFDCRDNEKWPVWLDFENQVINPALVVPGALILK